jgi:dihydroorotate dehydrogenase (NAD+) catalytic subunit
MAAETTASSKIVKHILRNLLTTTYKVPHYLTRIATHTHTQKQMIQYPHDIVHIQGRQFYQIMPSSGPWTYSAHSMNSLISKNEYNTIISKTCTLTPYAGKLPPNYIDKYTTHPTNSVGLPNLGYPYYKKLLDYYANLDPNINYILSVDASDLHGDLVTILTDYNKYIDSIGKRPEFVELNLSCPNLARKDIAAQIPSYSMEYMADVLASLHKYPGIHFALKLSPYTDYYLLQSIITLINQYYDYITMVVMSNTIPGVMPLRAAYSYKPALSAGGYGGLGGVAQKMLALGNIHFAKKYIHPGIALVGCGGVSSLTDIKQYLSVGAKVVQIGTYCQSFTIAPPIRNSSAAHTCKSP